MYRMKMTSQPVSSVFCCYISEKLVSEASIYFFSQPRWRCLWGNDFFPQQRAEWIINQSPSWCDKCVAKKTGISTRQPIAQCRDHSMYQNRNFPLNRFGMCVNLLPLVSDKAHWNSIWNCRCLRNLWAVCDRLSLFVVHHREDFNLIMMIVKCLLVAAQISQFARLGVDG